MAFCKNCGQPIDPHAAVCMKCGFAAGQGQNHCPNCGSATTVGSVFCTSCGFSLQAAQQGSNAYMPPIQATRSNAFCKNCGQSMNPNAAVCTFCGFAAGTGQNFCVNCGKQTVAGAAICINCGFSVQGAQGYGTTVPPGSEQKSKMVAGLLGIFLGAFGVHNFYLGKTLFAIIHLILGVLGMLSFCVGSRMWFGGGGYTSIGLLFIMGSGIWGLVEGILILTGHTKTDAKGNPLN